MKAGEITTENLNSLIGILVAGLSGRTWNGKENILKALASICMKNKYVHGLLLVTLVSMEVITCNAFDSHLILRNVSSAIINLENLFTICLHLHFSD
jgi:hypothetical protein